MYAKSICTSSIFTTIFQFHYIKCKIAFIIECAIIFGITEEKNPPFTMIRYL